MRSPRCRTASPRPRSISRGEAAERRNEVVNELVNYATQKSYHIADGTQTSCPRVGLQATSRLCFSVRGQDYKSADHPVPPRFPLRRLRRRQQPLGGLGLVAPGVAIGAHIVEHNKCYATCAQFADATLSFLREKVPRNWVDLCDSVTDNFRVISPKEFRVMR